jgi:aspartate kinase
MIAAVADRIAATQARGMSVVVVVSAMGTTTDQLLDLARGVSTQPDGRELDMLVSVGERITMTLVAMALKDRGIDAVSLTGSQSGIITDEAHSDARVVEVRPQRVQLALEQGQVVIVAGFQGVSRTREVTTLGRGGSDTTAVVLAAALGAEYCEICSDVDGVWSADPRVVPGAEKLDALGLDEALALARSGAKVLFEDAVRYARDHGVQIRASSAFGPGSGTRLQVGSADREDALAVTGDDQLVSMMLLSPEGVDAVQLAGGRIRRRLQNQLWVDCQNAHQGMTGLPGLGPPTPLAVVTAVGSGLGAQAHLLDSGIAALVGAGIQVVQAGCEGDRLWWSVQPGSLAEALRVVHQAL